MAVKKTDWTANQIADPSSICGWNPDMYGVRNCEAGQAYYDSLLEMYAEWGVDFIKCDDICNTNIYPHNPYSASHEVEMLAKAIKKCEEVLYCLCHRDQHLSRRHGTMRTMPTCGESQMISGMTGSF